MAIIAARYDVIDCGGVADGAVDDARRLAGLRRALVEEDVRAVFCARGGYGLLRVAANIPEGPPRAVVGFSDVTVLHAALWRRGVVSVHGPNVTTLGRLEDADSDALFALLENPVAPPPIAGLRMIAPGVARGPLVGGNLAMLSHLIGTPLWPDLRGAVVFLEDVNEEPYRVDRMLTHLRLAGALEGVAGIACGEFFACGDAEAVLAERLGELGVPVVAGIPTGHGTRNRALPHGACVALDAEAGILTFEEGAVS